MLLIQLQLYFLSLAIKKWHFILQLYHIYGIKAKKKYN